MGKLDRRRIPHAYNHRVKSEDVDRDKKAKERMDAICQREVTQRCKTFIRDPLEQLLKAGRLRGKRVG